MTTRSIVRFNRTARRARQWGTQVAVVSVIGTTEAQKALIDLQAPLETDLGFSLNNVTASAMRYDLIFSFASGSTVGDAVRGAWGIAWLQNDAIAAGAASVPNPINDSFDWMAFGGFAFFSESTGQHTPRGGLHLIDNNSMRKQRENHSTLTMVIAAAIAVNAFNVSIMGRTLFLLP